VLQDLHRQYDATQLACLEDLSNTPDVLPIVEIVRPYKPVAQAGLHMTSGVAETKLSATEIATVLPFIADDLDVIYVPNSGLVFCRHHGDFHPVDAATFDANLALLQKIHVREDAGAASRLDALGSEVAIWTKQSSLKARRICMEHRVFIREQKERLLKALHQGTATQQGLKVKDEFMRPKVQHRLTTTHYSGHQAMNEPELMEQLVTLAQQHEYRPSDPRIALYGGTIFATDEDFFRQRLASGLELIVARDELGGVIGFALYTPSEREDLLSEDIRHRYRNFGSLCYLNFIACDRHQSSAYQLLLSRVELESPNCDQIVGRVVHLNQRAVVVHAVHGDGVVYAGDVKTTGTNLPAGALDEPLLSWLAGQNQAEEWYSQETLEEVTSLGVVRPVSEQLREVASRIRVCPAEAKALSRGLLSESLPGVFDLSHRNLLRVYAWQNNREIIEWDLGRSLSEGPNGRAVEDKNDSQIAQWRFPRTLDQDQIAKKSHVGPFDDTKKKPGTARAPHPKDMQSKASLRYDWRGLVIDYIEQQLGKLPISDRPFKLSPGAVEVAMDLPNSRRKILHALNGFEDREAIASILSEAPGAIW
jgi:hypothetical protein